MVAFLTRMANLQKYTQVDIEKTMKGYQAAVLSTQKEKENTKCQFALLKSENFALKKSLDEAKVARDEALAMDNSLRSKYERQIRMAKEEVEEKMARAMFENDEAIKVLEEGMVDLKAAEELIKKEAYDVTKEDATSEILKYGMSFRHSTIYMIK